MSDLFPSKLANERKKIEALLKEQAGRVGDIEAFSALAKKYNVETKDLDELLKIAKGMFAAAGIEIPKAEAETKKQ